ncbi:MAG TPA: heparinase II/III family protein [Solirubrobacterales bacterium]|nr:heparinase II/III family protein [Solirubrobacterales bacterium]
MTPKNNSDRVARDQIAQLRELGRPQAHLVGGNTRRPTVPELRTGRFVVWNRSVTLRPPVDWSQDPFLSRSWRFQLNTLSWLAPLLLAHAESGDRDALAVARDLILDWGAAHRQTETHNEFAWYDMAVGLRSPYIAYALRACLVEEMLTDADASLLLDTALRHGTELASQHNYSAQHNHGLYQDEGLYLLSQQLPLLPSAPRWRTLALERLRSTLGETICTSEGGHLEHSSSYQFSITSLVSRLARNMPELDDLDELHARLVATSRWHVTPANRMAQLGDTDDMPAPRWACSATSELHGLKVLPNTGQAFVRDGDSYLALSAAHHSAAHKQSDETGFLLVENGVTVLGDAGRWGYYENEPDRIYARSAAAHNVLTVDDLDFQWGQATPYGSGLIAAGQNGQWYVVVVENRTLRKQGVAHRRLLLYRPRHMLVVVDDVRADEPHEYVRHFHFGPEVTATLTESRITLSAQRLSAALTDPAEDRSLDLRRGVDLPHRLGWTYPADRVRTEISTATLRTRATNAVLVGSLRIGTHASEVTAVDSTPDHTLFEFSEYDKLEVRIDPSQRTADIIHPAERA